MPLKRRVLIENGWMLRWTVCSIPNRNDSNTKMLQIESLKNMEVIEFRLAAHSSIIKWNNLIKNITRSTPISLIIIIGNIISMTRIVFKYFTPISKCANHFARIDRYTRGPHLKQRETVECKQNCAFYASDNLPKKKRINFVPEIAFLMPAAYRFEWL